MFSAASAEERGAVIRRHPRLKELTARYGEVLASAAPGDQVRNTSTCAAVFDATGWESVC